MTTKRGWILAALTVALALTFGSEAHAAFGDFTFSGFVSEADSPTTPATPTTTPTSIAESQATFTFTALSSGSTMNASGAGININFGSLGVTKSSGSNTVTV